jgi:hypothetical protein
VNFKKQDAQIKTQGFIKKGCFPFLAPILSACIITSSLIHEATTLMERLFKFLRPSFIGSRLYGSRLWFKAMKEKGFHQLKMCLRVSKILDQH